MNQRPRKRRKRKGGKYALRRVLLLLILLGLIIGLLIFSVKQIIKLFNKEPEPVQQQAQTAEAVEPEVKTAVPTELPSNLVPVAMSQSELSAKGFTSEIMLRRTAVESFSREVPLSFGNGDDYTDLVGITTFGGNNYRNTFTYGTQYVNEKRLSRIWEIPTSSFTSEQNGVWTGTGWTGMPLIIQWDASVQQHLGVYEQFKNKDGFTEVIYPAMDGYIYFAELSTGAATRDPMYLGVVTRGTATLDPRGYPLLYTGQGIPGTQDGTFGSWVRVISLTENRVIWDFGGADPYSYRAWQAYDCSPLIDAETDTLITAGENGILYSVKLNTAYDSAAGTVSVSPGNLEKYRYNLNGYGDSDSRKWWGVEGSVSAFKNYLFFADNGGTLQCVDVNTLETVYISDVFDDSDSSCVIEESPENGTVYLYLGSEVDRQSGISGGLGTSIHRKVNAMTGETVWKQEWPASVGDTSSNGGTMTTPHVGRGSISDIVIFNQTLVPVESEGQSVYGGRIVAYDKATGQELWRHEQAAGYWSSPVVIYDEKDNAYLIQCDGNGVMRMHDPRTGSIICELDLGSRVESTPAVFNNILVVGTRGQYGRGESQKIIGVLIK